MKRTKLILALAVAIFLLLIYTGMDRSVNTSVAYAASQAGSSQPIAADPAENRIGTASISLAQAPLALQIAVGALVLLFVLMAVIPPYLKEREP